MSCATHEVTVTVEPFAQIEDEWQSLAGTLERPVPFDFPAWHRAWWAAFDGGREPVTLALRDGAALVGIAPMMRNGDTIMLAGDAEICDYTDALVTSGDRAELWPRVLDTLDDLPWTTLHLWGLDENSSVLAETETWSAARGFRSEMDFEAVCPRVESLTDWESYLASLSKKDRHELRRKMRRFESVGERVELRVLSDPEAVGGALDTFVYLHRISRHDKREFMSEQMESFFRGMATGLAADDLVRLFVVDVDGQPAASLLAFVSGDELLLYNSGYDPAFAHASVGLVSKALTLKWAIENGLQAYDFLRGAEPYKYDLGCRDRILRQIWVRRDA